MAGENGVHDGNVLMCEVGGGRSGQKEDSRLEFGARGRRVGRSVGVGVADASSGF